ncbi:MAG TPA: hypothetical protein VK666_02685 [Chryseolinea sp.]|nr:hypothetical protein [Chryseolinea sp.]
MSSVFRLYRTINILSLDVAVGAVVCALFFSRILAVKLSVGDLLALGLSVWLIYTADHLADARKITHEASTPRHRFHQLYSQRLSVCMLIALSINFILLFFMRPAVLRMGIFLAIVICTFMVFQKWIPLFKEFSIALFYTAGVLLPAVARIATPISTTQYLLIAQFFLVALMNLLLFSWLDRATDERDGLRSIVSIIGENVTRTIVWIIAALQLLLMIVQLNVGELSKASVIVGMMGMILILILMLRRATSDGTTYRLLGDAVFLFPILYLL